MNSIKDISNIVMSLRGAGDNIHMLSLLLDEDLEIKPNLDMIREALSFTASSLVNMSEALDLINIEISNKMPQSPAE